MLAMAEVRVKRGSAWMTVHGWSVRVLALSHSRAQGARYQTCVTRSGLTASWNVAAPLGQSVPSLIGLSGLPSMLTMRPSRTLTSVPQPTAQYGQTLGTSLTLWILR